MAILKIARMGHPVLDRRAEPVADPSAPEIRRLVADMIETMIDTPGQGLAAPQVHVPLRIVVFLKPHDDPATGTPRELQVLINPVIDALDGAAASAWEGCLSVPGLRGLVPRPDRVRYRGVDLDGREIDRSVAGWHARVVQHECDHLDGMLYPRRMTDLKDLIFDSEWRHRVPSAADAKENA
jgi:peptide deformylase